MSGTLSLVIAFRLARTRATEVAPETSLSVVKPESGFNVLAIGDNNDRRSYAPAMRPAQRGWFMALTDSQVWAASKDDMAVLAAMTGQMPRFKELMEAISPTDLGELARRFNGFRRYAMILEALAGGIRR